MTTVHLLRQSRQNPRPTLSNPSAKCRNSPPPPPPSGGREAEVAPFGNPTPVALAKRGGRRRRRREENERRCFMSLIQPREGKEKCAFPRHEKKILTDFFFSGKNVRKLRIPIIYDGIPYAFRRQFLSNEVSIYSFSLVRPASVSLAVNRRSQ